MITTCIGLSIASGKQFGDLRRHFHENNTFHKFKMSFVNFLNNKFFNLGKRGWYMNIPQPE